MKPPSIQNPEVIEQTRVGAAVKMPLEEIVEVPVPVVPNPSSRISSSTQQVWIDPQKLLHTLDKALKRNRLTLSAFATQHGLKVNQLRRLTKGKDPVSITLSEATAIAAALEKPLEKITVDRAFVWALAN